MGPKEGKAWSELNTPEGRGREGRVERRGRHGANLTRQRGGVVEAGEVAAASTKLFA